MRLIACYKYADNDLTHKYIEYKKTLYISISYKLIRVSHIPLIDFYKSVRKGSIVCSY